MESAIIDSSVWAEYFHGSKKGIKARNILKEDWLFYTVECSLAEIKDWCLRHGENFDGLYPIIKSNSTIISVFVQDWLDAARERFEKRKTIGNFGLLDAILLSKQKQMKCKIIASDNHFRTLKNVIFIGD